MKVRIKKTGEIVNAASYASVALNMCDSYGTPIELPLDEIELIPDNTPSVEDRINKLAQIAEHQNNTISNLSKRISGLTQSLINFEHRLDDMEDQINNYENENSEENN